MNPTPAVGCPKSLASQLTMCDTEGYTRNKNSIHLVQQASERSCCTCVVPSLGQAHSLLHCVCDMVAGAPVSCLFVLGKSTQSVQSMEPILINVNKHAHSLRSAV